MKSYQPWHVILLGVVLTGLTLCVVWLGDLTDTIPQFLGVFGLLFLLYLGAVLSIARTKAPGRGILIFVFVVAAACRLAVLNSPPTLSTDIYRYLWEGRMVESGFNPFSLPPSAPELEFLRDENHVQVSHKHMETIYPPVAQGVFLLGAMLRPDLTTQKALFVLFDLGTMVMIFLLLARRGRNPGLCVVWGWSPLVIIEFAHSGHVDSVGIFFLMLAIYLWDSRKKASSIVALSFSFLSKYLSVLLLPFFFFKKRNALWLGLFVLIAVLGFLPFADASGKLFASLRTYGRYWEFNSAVYGILSGLFGRSAGLRIGLFAFLLFFSLYQGRRQTDLLRYGYLVVAFSLLVTPTLYPWYLCWLVPFLCFYSSRAWIYLTGMIVASYWAWVRLDTVGEWNPGWIVFVIEYVPFFMLLAWDGYRSLGRREEPTV